MEDLHGKKDAGRKMAAASSRDKSGGAPCPGGSAAGQRVEKGDVSQFLFLQLILHVGIGVLQSDVGTLGLASHADLASRAPQATMPPQACFGCQKDANWRAPSWTTQIRFKSPTVMGVRAGLPANAR